MNAQKHTVTALVEDKPGVLNRIASLFRRRGFNIESIVVGHSEVPDLSRLTLVMGGDEAAVEQVTKQLYKLIDVVKVSDITSDDMVARELALVKVRAPSSARGEIIQLADIFRANIVDVAPEALILEVTGDEEKIGALLELLRPFGIVEVMRSGRVALARA
ncbi:MAG: acetolactate synthase small subunit [Chloroflexi bacterium]|nr:acetolactate synthase small subunit [Chloroflexota bacterium]